MLRAAHLHPTGCPARGGNVSGLHSRVRYTTSRLRAFYHMWSTLTCMTHHTTPQGVPHHHHTIIHPLHLVPTPPARMVPPYTYTTFRTPHTAHPDTRTTTDRIERAVGLRQRDCEESRLEDYYILLILFYLFYFIIILVSCRVGRSAGECCARSVRGCMLRCLRWTLWCCQRSRCSTSDDRDPCTSQPPMHCFYLLV